MIVCKTFQFQIFFRAHDEIFFFLCKEMKFNNFFIETELWSVEQGQLSGKQWKILLKGTSSMDS